MAIKSPSLASLGDLKAAIGQRIYWTETNLADAKQTLQAATKNPLNDGREADLVMRAARAAIDRAALETYADAAKVVAEETTLLDAGRKLAEFVLFALIRIGAEATKHDNHGSPVRNGLEAEIREAKYRAALALDAMARHILESAAEAGL